MKQHAMQEAAQDVLHRAGIADRIGDIGTFRPPSGPTLDWILSDLAADTERGHATCDGGSRSGEGGRQAPANEVRPPRVFLGSGDRGVYGFAAPPGERLPSSVLFVLDPATLALKVQRGLLSTVVVLSGGPDGDVILRGHRFGQTRAAPSIAAIRRLISASAQREA